MKQRAFFLLAGATLLLVGIFLPTEWYDTIPRKAGMALPFSGVSLLRLTFIVESLVLFFVALRNIRFDALAPVYSGLVPERRELGADISRREAMFWLAAVTCLGIYLRIHGIEQDLWLDEISPLRDYMHLSPAQIVGSYIRSNNHLLNTLLERIVIGSFGESEWSVRLPAVTFGILTIPGLYWVARLAMSRVASVGSALVLAASYHHVFFSQNARGYSAYILFALLSTGFFIRALRTERLRTWALYVAAIVLGSASLLITAFVIVSHVIVCIIVGVRAKRRGMPVWPFARRIIGVLGVAGFIAFQIYAAALPEAYVVLTTVYAEPGTGYPPFSAEFFREMARGVTAGFGSPMLAGAFLVLGVTGLAALMLLSWPLALALTLPVVLMATALGSLGLTFSPRFFLLLLPLGILAGLSTVQVVVSRILRKSSSNVALPVLAAAGLVFAFAAGRSLPWYYRTPKQPYRAAIALIETRRVIGNVVVVSNATTGIAYYTQRLRVPDIHLFRYIRSLAEFSELTGPDQKGPLVVTTFSRSLKIEQPEIAAALERDWLASATFAATIGDGEIVVWSRKPDRQPQ